MTKSKIFCFFCLCFFLGIGFGFKFQPNLSSIYFLLALTLAGLGLAFFKKYSKIIFIFLAIIIFLLGVLRAVVSFEENNFVDILETKQTLEGVIVEDVDIRPDKQLLTFLPDNSRQKILLTTTFQQEYFYGDRVVVEGKIKKVENFGDFDYEKYLERHGIFALSNYPKILILKTNQANFFKYNLLKIKARGVEHLSNYLQEPHLSLLLGILIGAKKSLPKNIADDFSKVGLSHVVAVSGFNIAVLVAFLGFWTKFIGRNIGFWLSLIFISLFVVMAGASASVLRASCMGGLLLLALRFFRPYNFAPAILFSALLMLIINPKILFWDIGFGLSFTATLGIVYGVPLLENLTPKIPEWFGLKTIFLTTVSAIIVTLPLSLLYFGQVSVVAILVNVLVLPFIPLIMFLGFCAFLPFLSAGFVFLTFWLLRFVLFVVDFFARLPFSSVEFHISIWTFWILYGLIFMGYILFSGMVAKKHKHQDIDSKFSLW